MAVPAFVCPGCGFTDLYELLGFTPAEGALVICTGCGMSWRTYALGPDDRLTAKHSGDWMPRHVNNGEHYTVSEFRLWNFMQSFGYEAIEDLLAEFDRYVSSDQASHGISFEGFLEVRHAERVAEAERTLVEDELERVSAEVWSEREPLGREGP